MVATVNGMIWRRRCQLLFAGAVEGSLAVAVEHICRKLSDKFLSRGLIVEDETGDFDVDPP